MWYDGYDQSIIFLYWQTLIETLSTIKKIKTFGPSHLQGQGWSLSKQNKINLVESKAHIKETINKLIRKKKQTDVRTYIE